MRFRKLGVKCCSLACRLLPVLAVSPVSLHQAGEICNLIVAVLLQLQQDDGVVVPEQGSVGSIAYAGEHQNFRGA